MIVRAREHEQKIQGAATCRKNNKHTHLLRRHLNGMASGRVGGGTSRGSGRKNNPMMGFCKVQVPPMNPCRPYKPHLSSCTSNLCHGNLMSFRSNTLACVGGSFSARVPRSQRKYAGCLSTTSWKMKVSGSRNSRVIRDDEEGGEVNGEVEEIRSNPHSTHES